jgi:segregation and condensation protein B
LRKGGEAVTDTTQVEVDLKSVLGAIIFAARQPLTLGAIRKILQETAQAYGGAAAAYGSVKDADIRKTLLDLQAECSERKLGFQVMESAEGFRFQSDPVGGVWVRHMLDVGKPARLSRPGLETLAIIAYRQPVSRSEIEGVRGVAVDHVIRMLMEMQLIKIVGRSELPGRPMLYGTTSLFLEHFGLKELKELPGIEEMARMEALRQKQAAANKVEAVAEGQGQVSDGPEAEPATGVPGETVLPVQEDAASEAGKGTDGEGATP